MLDAAYAGFPGTNLVKLLQLDPQKPDCVWWPLKRLWAAQVQQGIEKRKTGTRQNIVLNNLPRRWLLCFSCSPGESQWGKRAVNSFSTAC
jgi:hypothetical protein